jgi:homoserine dehydrogenase
MKNVRIGIIGFGNVGRGFAQALKQKNDFYRKAYDINFYITAVIDQTRGCVYNPDGISLDELINAPSFDDIQDVERPDWNTVSMIQQSETDAILELTYTNLKTGEPAVLHIREAILSGKNVVTSNKGPIALHYKMLSSLAVQNGVKIGVEGTVMSGTPVLRMGTEVIQSAGITSVRGILNGTCNFILSEMEKGLSFEEALKHAQDFGYAEADPSGDVEGLDTAGKVSILSQLLFDTRITPQDMNYEGITGITKEDIETALKENCRWKLIGSVKVVENSIVASVKPEMLPLTNPLANVMGATNAIQYETDLLSLTTMIGPGAGRLETASALIQDLIAIYR